MDGFQKFGFFHFFKKEDPHLMHTQPYYRRLYKLVTVIGTLKMKTIVYLLTIFGLPTRLSMYGRDHVWEEFLGQDNWGNRQGSVYAITQ